MAMLELLTLPIRQECNIPVGTRVYMPSVYFLENTDGCVHSMPHLVRWIFRGRC